MSSERGSSGGWSRRRALLALGAGVASVSCIPDGRLKRRFHRTPVRRAGDWPVATPADVGLDPDSVDAAYHRIFDEDYLPSIRSMLVARHGLLVAEAYVADAADIDTRRNVMSATKSVTSVLAGIALDRGELSSPDATLADLFPEYVSPSAARGQIRLRDLLTMRSGIDYSNDDFSIDMEHGDYGDSVAHILSKPLHHEPGTVYEYTDATAHLAGAMVERATGRPLADFARDHLLSKIGVKSFRWLRHDDGRDFGAYGLFLTPRDFLRFGQATLEAARGSGDVVSPTWLEDATSFKVQPEYDFGHGWRYGYFWWLSPDERAFTAWGHGGQYTYTVPERDLCVVITADINAGSDVAVDVLDARSLVETLLKDAT